MNSDPLLAALTEARKRKDQADHDIRVLLAYARELVTPRPYRLADLAQAAGMSISGVRHAYNHSDVKNAARILLPSGSEPCLYDRHITTVVNALLGCENGSLPHH
jgi:hypothetical protein